MYVNKQNSIINFTNSKDKSLEVPIFLPPDAKNQLIGKDSDTGKD